MSSAVGPVDERSNLEKLDDLQAAHPLRYNLVVGLLVGAVLVAFGFHVLFLPLYAVSYGVLRALLWRDGRLLRRQYEARAIRWEEKRSGRGGGRG